MLKVEFVTALWRVRAFALGMLYYCFADRELRVEKGVLTWNLASDLLLAIVARRAGLAEKFLLRID